ncbi:MAG: imidazoleglycerol-phosphate dehydratase HisB [Thermodesulfobacteriota bacterium]
MTSPKRSATIKRETNETSIRLELNIDGKGNAKIKTGVPFLDHMLTLFTVHGFFDLNLSATGDTHIDDHHTVEDIGICLGQAFKEAMPGFKGVSRYGNFNLPMDETLAKISLDLCNRPFLHYDVIPLDAKTGTFDTTLAEEFFRAFAFNCGMTLHVEVNYGQNSHHVLEAIFKGLGRALDRASQLEPRTSNALSSKGVL